MIISYEDIEEYIEKFAYDCACEIVKYAEWELNNMLEKKSLNYGKVEIPRYYETQAFKDSFEYFSEVCGSDIIGFIGDFLDERHIITKYYYVDINKDEIFIDFYDDDEEEFREQLKEIIERGCQNYEPPCDAFCKKEYCGQLKETLEIILADEEEFKRAMNWDGWKQISEDADELKALMNELIEKALQAEEA
jgi:hypothetical protein